MDALYLKYTHVHFRVTKLTVYGTKIVHDIPIRAMNKKHGVFYIDVFAVFAVTKT